MTDTFATDILVETPNPGALDQTVQHLGGAVVAGSWDGTTCRVRVFHDPGFLIFAITRQGYGKVVGQERPV